MSPDGEWVVVMPVKGTSGSKSRLLGGLADSDLDEGQRAELALALALDAVDAARASLSVVRVVVVTSDEVSERFEALGALVRRDPGTGLNAAFTRGIRAAMELNPGRPVAAMMTDLAAVRPRDVTAALDLAAQHALGMLTDKDGTGTTFISALSPRDLTPRFGLGSARRHREAGHVELDLARGDRMRHDIDTADDLTAARELGLGPRARAVLGG
ncbi:2-phospho-L-lactate guanylyltransferase [Agreia sp. COWG]|uniref:2-phospho-L-lactate guanylyltransferase n=1 Tax=Agreia sp. COWG TaxID=2773266 RepID=UPI001927D68C|nr:2-phospho-L-lactate guanylyltransferase [Agreia sp. COWG]CAD5994652.1 Phosphoenolpyruvate guanylyltransferase [Agreia sp. COWG]